MQHLILCLWKTLERFILKWKWSRDIGTSSWINRFSDAWTACWILTVSCEWLSRPSVSIDVIKATDLNVVEGKWSENSPSSEESLFFKKQSRYFRNWYNKKRHYRTSESISVKQEIVLINWWCLSKVNTSGSLSLFIKLLHHLNLIKILYILFSIVPR